MPENKTAYDESKILFEDEQWLVLQPLTEYSYRYFCPPRVIDYWHRYYPNIIIFIIDKSEITTSNEISTDYMVKKPSRDVYYDGWGSEIPGYQFYRDKPESIKVIVDEFINGNNSLMYETLVRISQGEDIPIYYLSELDPIIEKFRFNQENPKKSLISIAFKDYETFFNIFNISESDVWYLESVLTGGENDIITFDSGNDEWERGDMLAYFNDKNMSKFNQLLTLITNNIPDLTTELGRESAARTTQKMFEYYVDDIITEWSTISNECVLAEIKDDINKTFEDVFIDYGIIQVSKYFEYRTTVGILLNLYKSTGNLNNNIYNTLKIIFNEGYDGEWEEAKYEYYCDDFDDESFNETIDGSLDDMLDSLRGNDNYLNIDEYLDLFKLVNDRFPIRTNVSTKHGTNFYVEQIDPKTNLIIVVVRKNNTLEKRSYTKDEFNNFINYPELFENKKRTKKIIKHE